MLRSSAARWLAGVLVLAFLASCGAPAGPSTLAPVVITVYRTGSPAPTAAQPATAAATAATADPQTSLAAASATAQPIFGPDTYPQDVNPLTGLVVGPSLIDRVPIAAKIANFPYAVRPQSGLSLADLVFEHLAEAGVTRFTAVFLQNDVARVGSIRSARFIDTEIAPMFGALLVTSGSSLGTMTHLRQNPWFAGDNVWRLVSEETHYVCPPLCRDTPDDTNTLFASTQALRAATAAQAEGAGAQSGFAFGEALPSGGRPVNDVLIDYSSAAHVAWHYNPAGRTYGRWQEKDTSGEMAAHIDAVTNAPITAANVVVLFVNHQNNFVPEDFRDGGNCGLEIQLWTIGPAVLLRDGQMYEGRWHRDESTHWRLRLEGGDGQPLVMRPGNTWLGIVGLTASASLNGATYSVTNKVLNTRSECPVPPTETPTETPEGYIAPTETPEGYIAPTEMPEGYIAPTQTPAS